ncbi:MAG: HipA domain-containing protein [Pseudolysinimonas sp.]
MSDALDVFLYGYHVGQIRRRAVEDYVLEYEATWAAADEAIPLSLSLPLATRTHTGRVVANFMDNLLPDNPEVRQRWATDAGLDNVEPFFLLREYGEDVAGAATFRAAGTPESGERKAINHSEIAERIRVLREDDTAWHQELMEVSGQFSLGGAQTKFSLARHHGSWFETRGADPSTHLFKPQVKGARDGELVEFVVMRTALMLGIPTARVELFDHDGQHSLVVERFDRRVEGDDVVRLHQEDVLQALGKPRLLKYESDRGPGIDDVAELLQKASDNDSRWRYATMLLFAWIVLSTDAHAKNYSLFIESDAAKLTPLYDASSVLPYLGADLDLDLASLRKRAGEQRLATRYGASHLARDVGRFELEMIARRCGMSADDLLAIVAVQLLEISDTVSDVASAMPSHLQTDTVARMVEWMPIRALQAAEALGIGGLLGS